MHFLPHVTFVGCLSENGYLCEEAKASPQESSCNTHLLEPIPLGLPPCLRVKQGLLDTAYRQAVAVAPPAIEVLQNKAHPDS